MRAPFVRSHRIVVALTTSLLIVVAGALAATVTLVTGISGQVQAEETYQALTRFGTGGSTVLDVDTRGRRWVWVRHDEYTSAPPTQLTVERDGEPVAASPLPGDVVYPDSNSAVTAVWAFDVGRAGQYTVSADSPGGRTSSFLVGTGNPQAEALRAYRRQKAGLAGLVIALPLAFLLTHALLRWRRGSMPEPGWPSPPRAGP